MNISEGWIRYENPSDDVRQNTIILAYDNDSASTVEEIRWHPLTGRVYRRRWWSQNWRTGPAGEVWFDRAEEARSVPG